MLYEKNQNLLKVCALCDARINSQHVVCTDHMKDLEQYHSEEWFIEMCRLQNRQYEIEIEEIRIQKGSASYLPLLKSAKPRSKLSMSDKNNILRLKKSGLGRVKIAKTLKLSTYAVDKFLNRMYKS